MSEVKEMKNEQYELTQIFSLADAAWSAELSRLFKKNAGDVRYKKEGQGTPGTLLNSLFIAREAARAQWEQTTFGSKFNPPLTR
jgi:hypothetical protein